MRKYLAFFRMRFIRGLQYRAAAWAGILTQFAWGLMEIIMFQAFYRADPASFPMDPQALASYIWMQQAFLTLFASWQWEGELFESITSGNVAYELCRPVSIYNMWFVRSMAHRMSRAALRCFPILIVTAFLPDPYGLGLPKDIISAVGFVTAMVLGLFLVCAFGMIVYMGTFYTISSAGLRMVASNVSELLCGSIIPLPFFPDAAQKVLQILPFASMNNAPLRIYGGDIAGKDVVFTIGLQIVWIIIFVAVGKWMEQDIKKKIVVQGG